MNVRDKLETASKTTYLVFVVFYADWSPHYEWIEPVLRNYEKRVIEVVRVNIEDEKVLADSMNVETVPAFVLLQSGKELWRQVGELTIEEFKEVIDEFR